MPELRTAIAAHQQRFYGLTIDPDTEVAVTTGATEAIAAAILGLVDPGDEVIVLEPYYDSYVAVIQMAGGVRKPVTLRAPDFRLPIDELRAAVSPRTTAILLNSPHNPTGTVLTREELDADRRRGAGARPRGDQRRGLRAPHVRGPAHPDRDAAGDAGAHADDLERRQELLVHRAGRSAGRTGPAALVQAMVGVKQFLPYTSGSALQPAIAEALGFDDAYFSSFVAQMQKQRDLLCDGLASLGFDVFVPEGTYFATTDIRPLGFTDGVEFCRALPELARVVAIPHQVFYDDVEAGAPLVRWAFCKRPEVIAEALERLSVLS